uniref:Uncharacterized protein n=1 Tax=Chromera velia CCMP2878 TaxID=1169474 RepID=A0A0G4HPK6_9ALVE|eukprot:Cvel_29852.t1-p1 / transcript=Cvel_29852.t1 / gene=Cvel_29852 / organism=Chromera_velia_CCMP2878 / gene_product=hypothetical protein / transcript_product=hypothetical protein / location=Cvel_scaffold4163:4906-5625(+) / protein_length=240 / sequence_SO=supercontig / SO=protein_coding / is_pseudo=false
MLSCRFAYLIRATLLLLLAIAHSEANLAFNQTKPPYSSEFEGKPVEPLSDRFRNAARTALFLGGSALVVGSSIRTAPMEKALLHMAQRARTSCLWRATKYGDKELANGAGLDKNATDTQGVNPTLLSRYAQDAQARSATGGTADNCEYSKVQAPLPHLNAPPPHLSELGRRALDQPKQPPPPPPPTPTKQTLPFGLQRFQMSRYAHGHTPSYAFQPAALHHQAFSRSPLPDRWGVSDSHS